MARPFVPIPIKDEVPAAGVTTSIDQFRVLQLNMLADGLSGLRDDLGAFSRAKAEHMDWSIRKTQLIYEILQYSPDLITLQECDHYYDFFLPELSVLGYDGLFAPKPASACLEVSENSDGCAIFLRRDKFRVLSTETITFALAKCQVTENRDREEDRQIRAQNQIALVALCELVNTTARDSASAPQLILCTTHLKATKNIIGEKTRHIEVLQLLDALSSLFAAKRLDARQCGRPEPVMLLTGDLNAAPNDCDTGFQALAYGAVKDSPLRLRSVLNDDLAAGGQEARDIWTTWKARRKKGKEAVAKSCIDYILYRPLQAGGQGQGAVGGEEKRPPPPARSAGLRTRAILELFSASQIGAALLPSENYPSDHVAIAADLEVVVCEGG